MTAFATLHEALRGAIQTGLGWRALRPVQELTIEAVRTNANVVILAPTAGGKTEASLIPVLDRALQQRWSGLWGLYICPLRALLNNLEPRVKQLFELVGLEAFKWHGDVPQNRKRGFIEDPLIS